MAVVVVNFDAVEPHYVGVVAIASFGRALVAENGELDPRERVLTRCWWRGAYLFLDCFEQVTGDFNHGRSHHNEAVTE
jgi:hypothetical protein